MNTKERKELRRQLLWLVDHIVELSKRSDYTNHLSISRDIESHPDYSTGMMIKRAGKEQLITFCIGPCALVESIGEVMDWYHDQMIR